MGDRESLDIYLNSASKNTSETDIFPYGTKSMLTNVINEQDAVLISNNSGRECLQRIFALGIFWGRVSCFAATPLTAALSPGHSDISRFRSWSPIASDPISGSVTRK